MEQLLVLATVHLRDARYTDGIYSVILIFYILREIYHYTPTSQCVSPYVGDGNFCVLDSDADSYPDMKLKTCGDTDTETYCSADTCPNAPNPDQSDTAPCIGDVTGDMFMYVSFLQCDAM